MFNPVDPKARMSELEAGVLKFWTESGIAERSYRKPARLGNFVFYEGPPTANGKPGLHHVSARAFKDLFPRYKTMRGYRVLRRGGWDTHGLPVEVEIEKQIGSTGKADIERFGIAAFNKKCRDSVFNYIKDWNAMTERIGFWIDLKNAYITYDNSYIESCWWILKSLSDRGLLYQDYKVTMHCPRCNTSLADHEVSQGMKEDVDDPSVWPKFLSHRDALIAAGIIDAAETRPVSLLAWTTTPWTLGANVALAVRGEAEYALVEAPARHAGTGGAHEPVERELFILGAGLVEKTFGEGNFQTLRTFSGESLVGLRYHRIMEGMAPKDEDISAAYRVIADPFVGLEDGTGIVHIAPAYGDLEIGKKHGLPTLFSVDLSGHVMPEVRLPAAVAGERKAGGDATTSAPGPYTGMFFKEADKHISRDLTRAGRMYRVGRVKHAYPFCWRDDSPLLFYAKNSWYIRTTAVKQRLLDNNNAINWVPANIKTGRFGRWLENNIDWAVSRERYWGCPLPVWVSDAGETLCVGSVAELSALTGRDLSQMDLHRPYVDEITFVKNGKTFRRLPYTVDVWLESGAMPYAQWHYPFENREQFEQSFPADFICEAADQTRGWFYSLHALATLLSDPGEAAAPAAKSGEAVAADAAAGIPGAAEIPKGAARAAGPLAGLHGSTSAFRNCVVLGFINDAQGRKMSKSRGNAVDPWLVLHEQGADALRWYLYSSGPADQNKSFDVAHVTGVLRNFLLPLWNVYSFFVLYARIDKPELSNPIPISRRPDGDRWLVSKLHALVGKVTEKLDHFDAVAPTRLIQDFLVNDVSNWYVRNNRRRFWKSGADADKLSAYSTLHEALLTLAKLLAPMTPFVAETIYQNLARTQDATAPESVHLCDWPTPNPDAIDERLLSEMTLLLRVVELGRAARASTKLKIRQPLSEVIVRVSTTEQRQTLERMQDLLLRELNVKALTFLDPHASFVNYVIRPNLPVVGKRLGKELPLFRKALETIDGRKVAENVRAAAATPIDIAGRLVEFEPEAFLVDVKSPESYSAVEEGGTMVALNTRVTDELVRDGWVRELVHHLQNLRKTAGLEVTDNISLGIQALDPLKAALQGQTDFICQEAMAKSLTFGPLDASTHEDRVEVDGHPVLVQLTLAI